MDWLTSETIAFMTAPQVGAYIMLLSHCWTQDTCTLPNNLDQLKQWGKWDDALHGDFAPVLNCFPLWKRSGRLTNPRLYTEWLDAKARTVKLREGGTHGAAIRWAAKLKKEKPMRNGRDYRAESKEVLQFLNEKTQKHFREIEVNLFVIEARLKSGVDPQTCKTLIMRKVHDWLPDPKMARYLRPETLFNKTKFETYLAEVTR